MSLDDDLVAWERSVPEELRSDVLWRSAAYRLATYAADFVWPDLARLEADPRTKEIATQLASAVGSIGANYSEGYSRGSGKDRVRIFEYALGSAREARHWTYEGRHVIGADRATQLLSILTRIIQLLTVTIVRERNRNIRPAEKPATTRSRRTPGKSADA